MKAGDALYKFFTEVVGIKQDDAALKEFISDPELSKTDINTVDDFRGHFMTFQEAKRNKAIIQEVESEAKKNAFGEYMGTSEASIRKWAKDNGIEPEVINQVFKDHPYQDKRMPAILKLIDENARKASGQTEEQWKQEKQRLYDETNALKRKLDEETTRISGEFTQKLTAKEREMILLQMKQDLNGVMKFRSDIPALSDLQMLRLQQLANKYHIVKTDTGYKFYDPKDLSKEVFDDKGKPLEFGKMVGELFPVAEFGETGKTTPVNGNGKTVTTPVDGKNVPKEVAEKLRQINENRPQKYVPQ